MNVLLIVVLNADACPCEVFQIVVQFDKEHSIVSIDEAEFLLESRCPERRLVRPVTLPHAASPRVAQLEQSDFFTLVRELLDLDQ